MKKTFALLLSAIMVVGGCINPVFAVEKTAEVAQNQSEEQERRNEYISYYSLTPPAGTSSSDYALVEGSHSGNLKWDEAAIDLTSYAMKEIIKSQLSTVFGPIAQSATEELLDHITDNIRTPLIEYAPESTTMDYTVYTYINKEYSTPTSEYYRHIAVFELETGESEQVTFYETRSWI